MSVVFAETACMWITEKTTLFDIGNEVKRSFTWSNHHCVADTGRAILSMPFAMIHYIMT